MFVIYDMVDCDEKKSVSYCVLGIVDCIGDAFTWIQKNIFQLST